ncbi:MULTISPECIES: hypothetical protein [unclassified Burkholderia]|uniref:hypothetical protein n=1 Tax=unclassified Burkholderia TaxID=2613784 RepID=UPI000F5626CB|nr:MULTISPECIES: hypothetical protein [unclassified Burkholderia]RQR87677.1 hypothetical protein DIE10_06205 [Burkholderia sp. Bp9011]
MTTNNSRADALPPMPSNVAHVMRRIRRCETEAAAQVVLEHFAIQYATSALALRPVEQHEAAPAGALELIRDAVDADRHSNLLGEEWHTQAQQFLRRTPMTPPGDGNSDCPRCAGSGEETEMTDEGPDAREITVNCRYCDGHGTLYSAYVGASNLLVKADAKVLELSGKLFFAQPEPPAADELAAFDTRACAESLDSMITEWVESCQRMNIDWRGMAGVIEKRIARFAARASSPNAAGADSDTERALSETIDERDQMEEIGTRLAEAVGEFLGVDVGEWSSANNPILAAIEALESRAPRTDVAGGVATMQHQACSNERPCIACYTDSGPCQNPSLLRLVELADIQLGDGHIEHARETLHRAMDAADARDRLPTGTPPSADAAAAPADALCEHEWEPMTEPHKECVKCGDVRRDGNAAPADAQAVEAVAAPFGWAQPKGGNYFTRSEMTAKRIGGLVPVYTAPPAPASAPVGLTDTQRLDWLRDETCDLRCIDVPTGGGDSDVRWIVVRHHMDEPHEREIGRSMSEEPRDAIDAALLKGDKQ